MPIKVCVYSHKGYGEFVLSEETKNIVLSKDKFKMSNDSEIFLSKSRNGWYFLESSKYIVYHKESPYLDRIIQTNCIYKIEMVNKESVYLFAMQIDSDIKKYVKYDISKIHITEKAMDIKIY